MRKMFMDVFANPKSGGSGRQAAQEPATPTRNTNERPRIRPALGARNNNKRASGRLRATRN